MAAVTNSQKPRSLLKQPTPAAHAQKVGPALDHGTGLKRFLRKPNVAEASEQFGQLAKELRQEECLQYAGFCKLAVARCEQTLFNAAGEALALTDAARLFLQAEKETQRLQCPGFEEHLQASTNCYSFAIKVYIELNQPVMAASLCLELGNALKEMNKPAEASVHFQRAAELQSQVPIECLLSLGKVATCKIITRDYDGALAVFTEMQLLAQEKGLQVLGTCTPVGAFMDVIARCEVSRVLLLMLLQPPPQKLLPEHAQTLEKYDWESFDSHSQDGLSGEGSRVLKGSAGGALAAVDPRAEPPAAPGTTGGPGTLRPRCVRSHPRAPRHRDLLTAVK
ncbi:40-kDa huntingtin-associated protein [Chiloscyllium plagiosum]|uniref:40-kDa huntingtin-associated protein n=1 Tax=Chiloscyllium plagiosum TaxID=36176 RepID=UPI001CB80DB2|nr:40-kDa huntingtin-associated protein [Chiloscyllium plagiosum]